MLFLPCVYSVQREFMFACCSLCQRASGALCGEFHVHEHARAQTHTFTYSHMHVFSHSHIHNHLLHDFTGTGARRILATPKPCTTLRAAMQMATACKRMATKRVAGSLKPRAVDMHPRLMIQFMAMSRASLPPPPPT